MSPQLTAQGGAANADAVTLDADARSGVNINSPASNTSRGKHAGPKVPPNPVPNQSSRKTLHEQRTPSKTPLAGVGGRGGTTAKRNAEQPNLPGHYPAHLVQ